MIKKVKCPKCSGEGWLWSHELEHSSDQYEETGQDDNQYPCDLCRGERTINEKVLTIYENFGFEYIDEKDYE